MGLKHNIVANYVSQAYVAAAGILTVPFYVQYMGTEAYGLIGFYTIVQAWFQILDAGLSTTLARETSRFSSGVGNALALVTLRRVMERIFLIIGLIGSAAFLIFGESIAHRWLNVEALSLEDVTRSVQLMGLIVASRWVSCLYRGVITGFEQQVWLGYFNVGVATARFVLYLPIVMLVDPTPTSYFAYQASVCLFEVLILYRKANRLLPNHKEASPLQTAALAAPFKFASGVAFTSIVWVLVTQLDKLILSGLLSLDEYGTYSLAVLLSGGINLLAAPIGAALLPRLTNIAALDEEKNLRELYGRYTQITCLAIFPAAFTLFACATPVLYAWTGNEVISQSAATVLGLYSLGNAIMGITAFAYYIQYAKGNIRLHMMGNAIFAAIYLPAIFWAARNHGSNGAAFAWLLLNVSYFSLWVPLVHRSVVPGLHVRWLLQHVLPVAFGAAVPALLIVLIPSNIQGNLDRWSAASLASAFFLVSLLSAAAGSSILRTKAQMFIRRKTTA